MRRDPLAADRDESDRRIASLLRSMDRKQRSDMLTVLDQSDGETAERIRKHLYVFEDLARIDDMSMQKMLRAVDMPTLAKALSKAAENIMAKVMSNLASRARAALNEELEMLGPMTDDDLQRAQDTLVAEIARLDREGQLTMSDE